MDLIIGWTPYETTFKGEGVKMNLLPLRVDEYRYVSRYMKKFDDKLEAADNAMELLDGCENIFARCVKDIEGVTVNGKAPTAADLSKESVLLLMAQDIIQELFLRSLPTRDEGKNSGSQSGRCVKPESIPKT